MTEQSGKRKQGNEMRRAAIFALLVVIGLCLLFLLKYQKHILVLE